MSRQRRLLRSTRSCTHNGVVIIVTSQWRYGRGRRYSDSCQETQELPAAASGLARPGPLTGPSPTPQPHPFPGKDGCSGEQRAGQPHPQGLKVTLECAWPGLQVDSGFQCDLGQVTSLAATSSVPRCPVAVGRCPGQKGQNWRWEHQRCMAVVAGVRGREGRPLWAKAGDRTEGLAGSEVTRRTPGLDQTLALPFPWCDCGLVTL